MPTLYRYLSASSALKTLESLRLRVGLLPELNDPFDCSPHFVGGDDHEREVSKVIVQRIFLERSVNTGVLCFSRTWSEPVLWSHYANSHKGMVLVLTREPGADLIKIKYLRERLPIQTADVLDDSKGDTIRRRLTETYWVKSPTWRYERETRLIIPLTECDPSAGSYFVQLPKHMLVGVILGLRCECSPAYLKRVFEKHNLPTAKIWITKKSEVTFKLTREEVTF